MELKIHLILVAGLAGVGKSTLAKALARRTRYAYYDKDALTTPLVERLIAALGSPLGRGDRASDLYLSQVRPLEYACLINAAMASVEIGLSAIVDAPLLREVNVPLWRESLDQKCLAAASGPVQTHVLWVRCDSAVMKERLSRRNFARDAAKLDHWEEYLLQCAAVEPPLAPFTEIDNSQGAENEQTVTRVLELLDLL